MKKYTTLLMLCLAFSYVKAQNIMVNSNAISVHEDVTFPFWLDSMSTIEIGTQVVSISALEFNIVPANNGNSLVFSQTKTITSQETVPNGTTWKITAVLLDSTAINNSSSSGGGQVIVSGSGGNMPVALSEEINNITMGDAMIYCDSLQEGGYDNWVVPNWEEMMFAICGGISIGGTRNNNKLWTSTFSTETNPYFMTVSTIATVGAGDPANPRSVRCVRHESISVNGSGSSSGGSNTEYTLGSGMPTMLSNESANDMSYGDAMLYCDSLNEEGYDNWVIPSLYELEFLSSGGSSIPGSRTLNTLWTRTTQIFQMSMDERAVLILLDGSGSMNYVSNNNHVRCTRYENVLVSGSGGSNTPSTLGSGMPTMISNESANTMLFANAMLYCDSLNEAGYSDWIMPTLEQISYASSGGCVFNDLRNDSQIWTRTQAVTGSGHKNETYTINLGPNPVDVYRYEYTNLTNLFNCRCVR